MDEYISRESAAKALMTHRGLTPIARLEAATTVCHVPAADVVEVVRCKDCKHRPYSTEPGKTYGLTIEAPDGRCPCYNEDDGWYSWVPDNEFFCFYGERKEG